MANIKISALPAAGAVASTDQFETNQGGTSRRATAGQIYALVLVSLNAENPLFLAGGNAGINIDGSAFFSASNFVINTDGSADISQGLFKVLANGDTLVAANTIGPILLSRPSNIAYRLLVNDAGVLSTEPA